MFSNQIVLISLTYILIISYVTSFQDTIKNKNQLNSQENTKLERGTKDYLKVQFPNVSDLRFSDVQASESIEDDDSSADVLSKEEVKELAGLVSSIQGMSVYSEVYHPFDESNSAPHRRRKRAVDSVIQHLSNVVKNLDLMVNSKKDEDKKAYFDKATSSLESYISGVKESTKSAKNSTIQIMKLDNVLIVQCGGWLWYPISRLNKTITCTDGVMRFESRDKTLARACNLYNCMDLAL